MSTNLDVLSPEFDKIRKGHDASTADAIRLLWLVLNDEIHTRRVLARVAAERGEFKVLSRAPTGNENNVLTENAGILLYTGSTAVNISGYVSRQEGDVILVHVSGTGTISHLDQSASSDATNRFVNNGSATVAVGTNQSVMYMYVNTRWREFSAA